MKYFCQIFILLSFFTALAGCSSLGSWSGLGENKAKTITIQASATYHVNSDANGQVAPLVIYVYQLTDNQAFNNNDFFSLYQKPEQILGGELLAHKEMVITPNGRLNEPCQLDAKAKYVGILAIYHDVESTQWHLTLPTSKIRSKKRIVLKLTQQGINVEEPTL